MPEERKYIKESIQEVQLVKSGDYWLKKLSGDWVRSTFPYDYKETVSNVRIIDGVEFRFSGEIFSRLLTFCSRSDLNLYNVLAAGLIVLLGKYTHAPTGSKDIIVGAPILYEQRKNIDAKPLNTAMVLRCQFQEDITFKEIYTQVGKTIEEANGHKDFPVEKLPGLLNMQVFGDDFPIFDTAVSLENIQDKRYIRHLNVNMIFSFFRTGKYIDGVVEFNSSLYEKTTVKKIVGNFTHLLQSALFNIDKELYRLNVFSQEEKQKLLEDLNDTKAAYPKDKTLQEIFERQVEKTPDNIALVFRCQQMTYHGFNQKANQLAYFLRDNGIKPDQFVGLMVERSMEMMVAMFAILKAGGAYLPIDPDYPRDRVLYLLADSGSQLLLTQEKFIDTVDFDGETIDLEEKSLHHGETRNLPLVNSPTHLAYAIYTSGSTGKPKGVMIEHWSVINLAYSQKAAFNIRTTDKILQFSTISFDASVEQIYISLFSGAALVLIDKMTLLDMKKFERFIDDQSLAHIHAVPLFVGSIPVKKYSGLKRMIAGGDICSSSLVKKWIKYCDFCNEYGPTETTVTSIQLLVKKEENFKDLSIGRPLNNTFLYILGKYQELVPQGVPGELCIGGDGVARGYMNRPELTAEKFIPNLFIEQGQNQRMYKTGDLARWLPDGNIDFLGRIDFQVKIRGFRIETGEIENQILTQPDQKIKEVVVCAREDSQGDKYLCAYLVADKIIDISALTNTLLKDLPEYMIPSYFVQIDKIPLTQSGKINRKQLPDPKQKSRDENYAAPRNEIEEKLVKIWSELLYMDRKIISIDDDFFRLGGHSLKVAVMITAIHKELNVKLVMRQVFDKPTIRELGQYIKEAIQEEYTSIPLAEEKEYYPQTSAQKRLFFIDQLGKASILYNMQMMDVYCKGIEKERLEQAFRKLIQRHDSLRTTFFTKDGEAVQRVHDFEETGSKFIIDYWETKEDGMIYSDQEGKEWTKVTGLPFQHVVEEFVKPFDLSKAPILRVGLIKIWGDTQILMVDMHHIMSDGVSEVLIIKDLWTLYEGKELPRLHVQYKDFAEWITGEEQEKEKKKQEDFWLNQFQGEIPVLTLPCDFPRPAKMGFDGDTISFEISKGETNRLYTLAQDQGVTLYMVLFAAYSVFLSRLSGQEDVVVGTVTAGRGHADMQKIVGMFVETLAVRTYPSGEDTFKTFLQEVKHLVLSAFEHQDYPLERLARQVAQRNDSSRNPLFDVVFSLENEAERTDQYLLEVLIQDKSSPYRFDIKKSKFDLMLVAIEKAEEVEFNFEYNTQLFRQETIERFVLYFKKIIASICTNIEQKVAQIDIMPDLERGILLYTFNDTETEYPKHKTIHELFEEQVAKTPKNTAVVFYGPDTNSRKTIDYSSLNKKANQLAHLLQTNGVTSESIVGITAQKSVEMAIGIMAILKAGGAYLPLNPDYPDERKQYLMEDSNSRILLTNFKTPIDYVPVVIDLDDESIYQDKNKEEFSRDYRKDGLAYIMYTSGSTGKPKGVMVEHVNVVRLVKNTNFLKFNEDECILQTGALEFDASTLEIWGCLLNGLTLYLATKDSILNAQKLKKTLLENKITTIWMTSALFNQMLDTDIEIFSGLKYLLTGGDIVSPTHVARLRKHVPGIQVINGYGPTENTTFSTTNPIKKDYKDNIPIGKPIANSTAYILDKLLNPVPMGVAGELFVGGDGVSRGYLNRPLFTHSKFVPDPFISYLSAKRKTMYATGDLSRWFLDGTIEFLGRLDFQVKIRGFRIEPGEIENQLRLVDFIEEVCVVPKKDESGFNYLCAYFVSPGKVDITELKRLLQQDLPAYMIPSYFVQMDTLPLTSNGKVDRRALPEPQAEMERKGYEPPGNEVEQVLADTWSEVLGIEKIGIDDDFFEIGGDSIKTIMISARLLKQQLSTTVNDFFIYPTIRELSKNIKKIEHVPVPDIEAITRDEKLIAEDIKKDYEKYLEEIQQEKWPDITVKSDYRHILLTGATGYLGANLVHELLNITNAILYLPVRGASQEEVETRLNKRLSFYFGKDFVKSNHQRIVVLCANLREKHLGIPEYQYEELCNTVEAVLHSAANVKHFGLYEEFYKDNVQATEILLEFAAIGNKKDFHFISTMDTGRGEIPSKDYFVFTEYNHDVGQKMEEVYIKSKFEAEKRVLSYRSKDLNTSIYRASNMTFHSETGLFQENIEDNFFYSMLNAFIKVGFWSDKMLKITFDLSFVNEAAKAITLLFTRKHLENQTYHICNPHMISWIEMAELLKQAGVELPDLDPETVKNKLSTYAGNSEYEKIIERVKVYSWEWENTAGTLIVPKVDRTVTLLKKIGFEWPIITKEHIKNMINHCKEVGFI
jgi:amino acid adenylation domain-containing protein/thioester reductase-like protein